MRIISKIKFAAMFSLATALLAGSAIAQSDMDDEIRRNPFWSGRIVGTWEVVVTARNCQTGAPLATFPATATFNNKGTILVTEGGIPPSLKTPAQGSWTHTWGTNFRFRTKAFNFSSTGALTGWLIINQTLNLDRNANGYDTFGTAEVYNPQGVLVATNCSTTTASRFE